ncbi:FAD-dependent oxidoreductase [Aestuariivirga litoralis]|uniref:FAD-dependent oxidoreductase n=1 Tax=Aestuariivirga litoralis TaxID=2650924 RepID=A0A2W2B565_9HYPH|nr:FAD-binding oxidoreductase [Aestuariivirga litoralis]PZF75444.1 FAD-dependent oxidoreductase [Aestuariivirga litoralis]
MNSAIFTKDFKPRPFWWEAHEPKPLPEVDLPKQARVVIVGAGYAGLNAALELNREGLDCIVLDANEPGFGGSSRNGGMVSGGVNVGKRYMAKAMSDAEAAPFLNDAADAFSHVETLIARENIDCGWHRAGYFLGAWCKSHYDSMAHKVELLNETAKSEAYIVPPERQREEIGSDYYRGGMVVGRAGHLHPALFFKGLLDLCQQRNIPIATKTPATKLTQTGSGWRVDTPRGSIEAGDVIIATNGYTGDVTPELKRRVVPVGSYIIATEELPPDLAATISPKNRSFADTRRVLTYYRMSPDGRRLIFGGRAKFGHTDPVETAPILYGFMTDRFPQLKGSKITHAWTGNVAFTLDEMPHMGKFDNMHYALGCNGSGVAMMSYLGHQTARKIAGKVNHVCAFDRPEFPDHALYTGNTWFLPWIGRYFRTRDWLDRRFG